jgi:hypothetical protein
MAISTAGVTAQSARPQNIIPYPLSPIPKYQFPAMIAVTLFSTIEGEE